MQEKKNPYRFTIQFDSTDPSQYLAAQVLSILPSRKKARFLSMLIQAYVKEYGLADVSLPELNQGKSGLSAWVQDPR